MKAVIVFFTLSFHFLSAQPYRHSVGIHVPVLPLVFSTDGVQSCYYELYVTSFSSDTISIDKIDISANNVGILTIEGSDLQNRCAFPGFPRSTNAHMLTPGGTTIIYIEIHSPLLRVGQALTHTISIKRLRESVPEQVMTGFDVQVLDHEPLVVGAPLRGGPWTAVYDPAWQTGHRRMIYTTNGTAHIPGRYAIDFILLNNEGQYAVGDDNITANWLGYGQDVLAVADAEVSSVNDTFEETKTVSSHPGYTPDKATGNYISLKIRESTYVFYEHLKPGSIRVKPGQRVKKGDVIASLGFTGQSTGPHLHFHVSNRDSALGAEGIPFAFEQFTYMGGYVDFSRFGKQRWETTQNGNPVRLLERPASNTVIIFPLSP